MVHQELKAAKVLETRIEMEERKTQSEVQNDPKEPEESKELEKELKALKELNGVKVHQEQTPLS